MVAVLGAVSLCLVTSTGQAGPLQQLHGHVPKPVLAGLQPLGRLAGTNHLRLAFTLPLRDQAGLSNLLQQIYDPASANFRQYLTPEQFTAKFGPIKADYQALETYVTKNGLKIIGEHPNRTVLDVDMTVADIERLFGVKMGVYQHPTEKRNFYAPDREPSVDLSVPLLRIEGLNDYMKPKPASVVRPVAELAASPGGTGSGPFGSYLGSDFRDAYIPGVSLTGTGQKVALFELDGYYASDITAYEMQAGEPNVPLENILIDGFSGLPISVAGDGEVSLDIEMVIDMAPSVSEIVIYEATNGGPNAIITDTLNRIASDDLANQISSSWLIGDDPTWDQIYQQYALQGQSFYQASGDNGAFVWSEPGQQRTDTPYVTLVGGTTLTTTGPAGSWLSETVWNWNSTGEGTDGSGGGISPNYLIPSWQTGISMTGNGGSSTQRNIPDVAWTADNIWVVSDQGQSAAFGGTSCAAPLWAAFTALMNQQAAEVRKPKVGFLNPTIYAIAKGPLYGSTLHDIITGNDTNADSPDQFFAARGYDLCTGWGTPAGSNLINAIVPPTLVPVLAVVTNFISGGNGNGVIDFDECNNLTVVLTNEGDAEATGILGVLSSTTPGVIVAQSTSTFPDLPPGQSAASSTTFTISTVPDFVCGTPVDLTLVVKSVQTIQTNFIVLPSGVLGSPDTFSNTAPVIIPLTNTVYSPILVSGLESVGQLTVSVDVAALFDSGLTLQLISPNGTAVTLAQNEGGLGANFGSSCVPAGETTFDDSAQTPIGLGAAPFIGSYVPQMALSTFNLLNGTNLNGVWLLSVFDEFPGDTAQLQCWSLNISPEVCVDGGGQCPGSDLSLTMTSIPSSVLVDSNFVYQLTVSNAGPSSATDVAITQTLPTGVYFVTATNYPVTATPSGTNLNLSLGALAVYGTAVIDVVANATIPGLVTSVASVGSPAPDPNLNNNTAAASTLVSLPGADLAVSMTASPASVLAGAPLTYTINVTNNGPFAASSVVLDVSLPANVNVISGTTTQGTISANNSVFNLGPLAVGTNVVVTIVVIPTITGNITASAEVSLGAGAGQIDPISFNNTASVTVTIGPSADLGVSAVVIPTTVLSGSNFTYVATIVNNGPSTATSVNFSQTMPGGAIFVSSSQSGIVVTNGIIDWTIGTMAAGSSEVITNVLKAPTLLAGIPSEQISSTLAVFGQPGDPFTNNNSVTLQSLVEPPTITIVPVSAILTAESYQPPNGAVNPGETVSVQLNLQNTGNVATTNLQATLLATGGVTLPTSGALTYGVLAPGAGPTGQIFSFTAQSTNGGIVVATLQLNDGSANLGTVVFDFYMPNVVTFWNTNLIDIPAAQYVPQPDDGPASPYPSVIAVSNISGFVSKVTVTVSNLTHSYPHDIGLLLVGPLGGDSVLMSAAAAYSSMSDATITFDQTASVPVPSSGPMVSGTYEPEEYNSSDFYPSNAPVGPYVANLSVFGGLNPNGNWSLYAYDSAAGDAGGMSNGWAVTVTTITPVNQEADLAAYIEASATQVILGGSISNLMSVTNNGPSPAQAYLTNVLPSGLSFVSASLPSSNYVQNGQTTVYNLGLLGVGSGVTITNVVTTTGGGPQTNTVTVGAAILDPNPGNNSASVVYTVAEPLADLDATVAVTNSVVVNSDLTYELSVSNFGPSNALNVVGTFSLAGLAYVSSSSSQGSVGVANGVVTCSFGTLPVGDTANVFLTTAPQAVGTLTNVWTVSGSSDDPNLANNTVTTNVNVTYPVPIIVADGAALLGQTMNNPNGAINANETVTVAFTLTNIGAGPTTNLVATLEATGGITPSTTSQTYGRIVPGGSGTEPFVFAAQGVPGATVTATLSLSDQSVSLGTAAFQFIIPVSTNYSSSGAIVIPEVGPGTPYPSQILVSGLTNLLVSQVTATLNGFSHSWPHDVNVLLVSPSGQELVLMAHTGGAFSVNDLTLTFSDSASQMLPTTQLSSGVYLPTDYAPYDVFPGFTAPANSATALAVFDGLNPNGDWSLYVYDDTAGNSGIISSGWSLGLTAVSTVNPASRLAAGMIHAPDPVYDGDYLNYQITVTNLGPDPASSVVITDTLPASVVFTSATVSQGGFAENGQVVVFTLGTLDVGATGTATIKVVAEGSGTIVNSAVVTTASTDLYLANSTTANNAQVLAPPGSFLRATNLVSGLQLTLLGQASQNYGIQVSSDLIHWTTITTNTTDLNGTFIYTDTSTRLTSRFYRSIRISQ